MATTQLDNIFRSNDFVKEYITNREFISYHSTRIIKNLLMARTSTVLKAIRKALLQEACNINTSPPPITTGNKKDHKVTICEDIIGISPYSFFKKEKQPTNKNTVEESTADSVNSATPDEASTSTNDVSVTITDPDLHTRVVYRPTEIDNMEVMQHQIDGLEIEVAYLKAQLARSAQENEQISIILKKVEKWTSIMAAANSELGETLVSVSKAHSSPTATPQDTAHQEVLHTPAETQHLTSTKPTVTPVNNAQPEVVAPDPATTPSETQTQDPNATNSDAMFEAYPISAAPISAGTPHIDIYIGNVDNWHTEEALRYHIHKHGDINRESIIINKVSNESTRKSGLNSFKASIPKNKLNKVLESFKTLENPPKAEIFRSPIPVGSRWPRGNTAYGRNNRNAFRRPATNATNPQQSRYYNQRPPHQQERRDYQPREWNPPQWNEQRGGQYYQPQRFDQNYQRPYNNY